TGLFSVALVAGPRSPELPPLNACPATVVMIPVPAATLRTQLLSVSAIKILPALSTQTPLGTFSNAAVAGPLSPANWLFEQNGLPPLPATVVMIAVERVTFRMR